MFCQILAGIKLHNTFLFLDVSAIKNEGKPYDQVQDYFNNLPQTKPVREFQQEDIGGLIFSEHQIHVFPNIKIAIR